MINGWRIYILNRKTMVYLSTDVRESLKTGEPTDKGSYKMFFFAVCLSCLLAVAKGQCRGKADLVIAVPGASYVPGHEFEVFEKEIIKLLNYFDIKRNQFNIGLVIYGEKPRDIAWPQPFKRRNQINTRVTILSRRDLYENNINGRNDLADAIDSITWMLSEPPPSYSRKIMRPKARKIGIIFVYGQAANSRSAIQAAAIAKARGITMYALGANSTGPEFKYIGYDNCRLFSMGSFRSSLSAAVPDLASGICSELDPTVTVQPGNCFPKQYHPFRSRQRVRCTRRDNNVADPDNCAYYYRCLGPGRAQHNACPVGTIFDPNTLNCNFQRDVACYTNVRSSCPKAMGIFEHPLECGKFVNCFNYVVHVMDCPAGTLFDKRQARCAPKSSVRCNKRMIY